MPGYMSMDIWRKQSTRTPRNRAPTHWSNPPTTLFGSAARPTRRNHTPAIFAAIWTNWLLPIARYRHRSWSNYSNKNRSPHQLLLGKNKNDRLAAAMAMANWPLPIRLRAVRSIIQLASGAARRPTANQLQSLASRLYRDRMELLNAGIPIPEFIESESVAIIACCLYPADNAIL